MADMANTYENEEYLDYLKVVDIKDEIATDERLAKNDNFHMMKHNGVYTKLLKCYVNNIRKTLQAKYWFKIVFFSIIMSAIVTVLIVFVLSIIYAFKCENIEIAVAAIVGAFVSFISATITLPSIIAKYLFNFNEEKDAVEIIKGMQEFDKIIRKRN